MNKSRENKYKRSDLNMKNNFIKRKIRTAVLHTATKQANSVCAFFFYQPKLPEAVKKLRKF